MNSKTLRAAIGLSDRFGGLYRFGLASGFIRMVEFHPYFGLFFLGWSPSIRSYTPIHPNIQ
jgi:hypothetical protein